MKAARKVENILNLLLLFLVCQIECRKGFGSGEQEWGFVEVRDGAYLFYWLFYVQNPLVENPNSKPLVLWLQGNLFESGSGFGNFAEIGPMHHNGTRRVTSWVNHVNVLFVDSSVGAGFSYVLDYSNLASNFEQIGDDLLKLLISFFDKYPIFQTTPLYIFGEGTGAKSAIITTLKLHSAVKESKIKAILKGIALRNPWLAPRDCINQWTPYLLEMGMIDAAILKDVDYYVNLFNKAYDAGKYSEAMRQRENINYVLLKDLGDISVDNILYKAGSVHIRDYKDDSELKPLMNGPVRSALEIPSNITFGQYYNQVSKYLRKVYMEPMTKELEVILDSANVDVTIYNGVLNVHTGHRCSDAWLNKLSWSGAKKWKMKERQSILLNHYVEGYVKSYQNLFVYYIHRSGRLVTVDNPTAALEILRRVTKYDK